MKKILYIHHGGSEAGAPRSLSFLINQLDQTKYEAYVVCCSAEYGNKKIFEGVGAKFIFSDKFGPWHGSTVSGMNIGHFKNNILKAIPTYNNIPKILNEIKPDIVHLNSTCLFMCAKATKKYNKDIPVICHIREPLLPNFWGDILKNNCNKYVDQYIAIEQFDANSLKPTTVPTEVVYNFVDFDTYNSNVKSNCLRKELSLAHDDILFLYLARIAPCNGALEMMSSVIKLVEKNKKIHFCIVGANLENKDEYLLKVMEKANDFPQNIHVLPFRSDVPQVIASSDVMVVPFQEPHFARSVIEAGSIGVPSVASNIGGLDELVVDGKTGFFFNYKTFDGFVEKCELLANDIELRIKMGKQAEIHARENFDAVKNSRRVFGIYEKLLK